jgi:hypothetical protein
MTTIFSVLVGVALGLALLAAVFLVAFRRKFANKPTMKSADNYDVFDKDPSFYSSNEASDK